MLLSVYIITYNHERYIAQAIDSVLMQKTNFEFEIVIGEDSSTDNTRDIIQSYISRYPDKIRLITSNKNVGAGRNAVRTLKACKGKYIASLEGDDYWITKDKLQKQVDILEQHSNYSMCFSNRSVVDANSNIINKETTPERFKKRTLISDDIIGGFTPPTQTAVFRSEYLIDIVYTGLEKVFNGESYAFSYFSTFGDVVYLDEVTASYRLIEDGVYTGSDSIKRLEHREITFTELRKILPDEHQDKLNKGFNALNQRLYVLYLKNFNLVEFIKRVYKLILFDIKNLEFSFIKANRLLLKSVINRDFKILD